ncbi:MAG: hypothetical protein J0M12_16140 [Deltaproteobacteria bacterium]|nr:hypothetical protein [Deltaproteobacteria bacterium]
MGVSRFTRKITEAVRHKNAEHASLALRHLATTLSEASPARILDLGAACSSNIKYYSKIARKFHFEDLSAALASKRDSEGSVLDEALSLRSNQRFDLIFCWDILNYLSPQEIERLGSTLAAHSHCETKLFLLLPVGREISGAPLRFKMADDYRLEYEPQVGARMQSPRYNKTDLKKLWPGFERQKSFLLKNGFEEHIYRCAKQAEESHEPSKSSAA